MLRLSIALSFTALVALAAPQGSQRTFANPQEAAQVLTDAAEHNDSAALLKIFGPQGKDIVDSGDAVEDKTSRAEFARMAKEKVRAEPVPGNPDRATVVVGSQDWPFPVPLVRRGGQWHFDSAAGRVEILARRVGRNEVAAVDVCRAYVEAQMDYATHDRDGDGVLQYAQKIVSTPGKKDGLYWQGEQENLVPKAFADASAAMFAEGKTPKPYQGYYFHVLKAQGPEAPGGALDYVVKGKMMGGFALVAFPAEYGVSGIKTFIVSHQGVVYQKDLGAATATTARQMTRFNPDKSWKVVPNE
ncbi:MAG TPA: DUF2950 domain-containing protein [Bryobacteraceae bacterium]|jgi:hypothetical protein